MWECGRSKIGTLKKNGPDGKKWTPMLRNTRAAFVFIDRAETQPTLNSDHDRGIGASRTQSCQVFLFKRFNEREFVVFFPAAAKKVFVMKLKFLPAELLLDVCACQFFINFSFVIDVAKKYFK